ncbi:hypothetical protein ACFFP0_12355 [Rhizobium puerariae]|uniref:Oligopeptide/dipeptide ABC transporter C-terminal domain-containing protein n=1 Tax=Rhizobium puerariae TaxID=1585791 RepID=A0ABV6AIW7_9HYPH
MSPTRTACPQVWSSGKVIEQCLVRSVLENPQHNYTRTLIAAGPRYDRPDAGLEPVPEAVFRELR